MTQLLQQQPKLVFPQAMVSSPILCGRSLLRIDCSKKRTGKQRYPSEKKKKEKLLLGSRGTLTHIPNKLHGFWRLSNLNLPVHDDPGKDSFSLSPALLQRIADLLHYPVCLYFFFLSLLISSSLLWLFSPPPRSLPCCPPRLFPSWGSRLTRGRCVACLKIDVSALVIL